jgi:hypothetical protein
MRRNSKEVVWSLLLGFVIAVSVVALTVRSESVGAMTTAGAGGTASLERAVGKGGQGGWRVGSPVSYENMTVFPVLSGVEADTSGFETLDEALASGDALITEGSSGMRRTRGGTRPAVYSGAQVNQLALINRGKRPLLLLAGEVVSGGKQDRIIGKDRIVPAGAEPLPLDVFCVEHGRWTGGSDEFVAAKTIVKPSVREKAAVDQDQGKVWAAVRGEGGGSYQAGAGVGAGGGAAVITPGIAGGNAGGSGGGSGVGAGHGGSAPASSASNATVAVEAAAPRLSAQAITAITDEAAPTQSYKRIYESPKVAPAVEEFAKQVEHRFKRATKELKGERVVGVVVAYGGEIAWSDIFASSQLFQNYWPKLLRSYVTEALTRPGTREAASVDDARDFLHPIEGHTSEEAEPGVYRWSERSEDRLAQIELESLSPKVTLHWMRVLRVS